jgi:glycosyltransferase involved in cell wall biosynthesis
VELYSQTLPDVETFNATSEILKVVVRRPKARGCKRILCFHSWRSVIAGEDFPLDTLERQYFRESNCADLPTVYRPLGLQPDFDVFFSSLYTPEHYVRKRVDILFDLLTKYPHLKVAWVGGYSPYERWSMEDAFNAHFQEYGDAPLDWGPLWSERESFLCWYHGGGIFHDEVEKHSHLRELTQRAWKDQFNIQFYANLPRSQVVHLLNRSRVSLSLARLDQWPRCTTEALACGTPVVCMIDLIAGKQVIQPETGIVSTPEPDAIYEAVQAAAQLPREEVRNHYYSSWGLQNATRRVVECADEICPEGWSDIVSVQRPAETQVKEAIRALPPWTGTG